MRPAAWLQQAELVLLQVVEYLTGYLYCLYIATLIITLVLMEREIRLSSYTELETIGVTSVRLSFLICSHHVTGDTKNRSITSLVFCFCGSLR